MNNVNKVLLMMIAMLAIMLLAVGIDKGIDKVKDLKWEQERVAIYEEARADIETMQATIETLSKDPEALTAYIEENELNYVEAVETDSNETEAAVPEGDLLENEVLEASASADAETGTETAENAVPENSVSGDTVSENTVSGNTVSENMASDSTVSGNAVSENTVSGNTVSGNTVSENTASDSTVSGNAVSENTVSGNTVSDNTVSGNTVSGNTVSGNTASGNIVSENNQTMKVCASYEETIGINHRDQAIIAANTMDFSHLKIACLGDSITQAANLMGTENYEQSTYPYYLKEILGAKEAVNLGIGGSSIGRYWENAFVDRYTEIPADADLIIVMGGTNDGFCASERELGSLEERKAGTFAGDLDELLRGLKENYPEAVIVLVTPPSNVLHDMLKKERDYLLPQSTLVAMMLQLAEEYQIPVIDLYHDNLLNTHDAAVIHNFMPDGVHGNAAGYRILAEHIAAELITLYTGMEE